ncbi:hypothetical protein BH23ACT3_BH23ACT3_10810 [soil metagenome]
MFRSDGERAGRTSLALALLLVVVFAPVAVGFAAQGVARLGLIAAPAVAVEGAMRGQPVLVRPPPAAPSGCKRVAVIGDSLTDNAGPWLRAELQAAGFTAIVDAQPSRRIPGSVGAPYSGVRAAHAARATWGDADCWVVALGSNDLFLGAGDRATAPALIDEMLSAVTPGARVWWVNVHYRRDPSTSFDFPAATTVFNAALDARAAADPLMDVVDWYSYADANLQWFFDPVHVDRTGSIARAIQVVDALPRAG